MSESRKTSSGARSRIFIDGAAGTVGLGLRQRLEGHAAIELVEIEPRLRKDPEAKRALLETVDVTVLCLPDAAARETVAIVDSLGHAGPKVLDASTAHRVSPEWTYGFAELEREQAARIRSARKVTNPGCYPTGAIALLRPLVDAGLIAPSHPISINAVSGYSGGGASMIDAFEAGQSPAFKLYGLNFQHKHLPELQHYARLQTPPLFVPSVGNYRQGMLVSIPLHLAHLPSPPSASDLFGVLSQHYADHEHISVHCNEGDAPAEIEPEALNGTNQLELRVYGNDRQRQAVLVARLDNLGKGASGAAVQNLELMLSGS